MASPQGQQQPWTNAEKIYLLAEIIKLKSPPAGQFLQSVNHMLAGTQIEWANLALPPGRSLNSCVAAFEELRRTTAYSTPSTSMLPMGPQSTSPMSAPTTLKRPFPHDGAGSFTGGRLLQPKPSMSNVQSGQQSPLEQQPHKKKRGRPTKAEQQARAEAQAGGGDSGPAPRPQFVEAPIVRQPIPRPPEPQIQPVEPIPIEPTGPPRAEEGRPTTAVSRMQISSIMTPTGQKSNSQSSSSSGKRRRGRSTRSEPEDLPSGEGSGSRQTQPEYESPYARMGAEAQDSPARTAVLRHRDESDPRTPYTSAQQDQPSSTTAPPTTGPT